MTCQQILAFAEQDRRDRQVQLVDETRTEILPNGGNAADADVLATRHGFRLLECRVNAVRDEKELRSTGPKRWPGSTRVHASVSEAV